MHWLAAYHANVCPVPPSVSKWALGTIYNTMLSSMQAVGRNIEQQEGDNFFEVTLENNPNWSQSYMQNSNKKRLNQTWPDTKQFVEAYQIYQAYVLTSFD